jgi:hypothetical protein
MASMGNIKIEIEEVLVNDNKTLREALSNLLDVFERCEAGFPPDVELRFLARDLAKAALTPNGAELRDTVPQKE